MMTAQSLADKPVKLFLGKLKIMHRSRKITIGDWEKSNFVILSDRGHQIVCIDPDFGTKNELFGNTKNDYRKAMKVFSSNRVAGSF